MVSRENFEKYLDDLFSNEGDKVTLEKFKKLSISRRLFAISFIGIVFCTIFLFTSAIVGSVGLFIFSLLVTFLDVFAIIKSKSIASYCSDFFNRYKDNVVGYLLSDVKYEYYSERYIDSKIFKNSDLGGMFDSYSGEDLLRINIPNDDNTSSNVYLNLCDLHVTETDTDSDGNSTTTTIFDGTFGYVEFPDNFKCNLAINANYNRRLAKIILEDINFNKKYHVYSDDQIEARYILTPNVMEKIMKFDKIVTRNKSYRSLSFNIKGNTMYIGIEGGFKLFEPHVSGISSLKDVFFAFYDDIEAILLLVSEIKNNNKIFKM